MNGGAWVRPSAGEDPATLWVRLLRLRTGLGLPRQHLVSAADGSVWASQQVLDAFLAQDGSPADPPAPIPDPEPGPGPEPTAPEPERPHVPAGDEPDVPAGETGEETPVPDDPDPAVPPEPVTAPRKQQRRRKQQ